MSVTRTEKSRDSLEWRAAFEISSRALGSVHLHRRNNSVGVNFLLPDENSIGETKRSLEEIALGCLSRVFIERSGK